MKPLSKDFAVPIEYSNVDEVIPVGEEIIYSTLCNITHIEIHGISEKTKDPEKYVSHVVLTPYTVGFSFPQENRPSRILSIKISKIKLMNKGFSIPSIGTFIISYDPKYETDKEFKDRRGRFYSMFKDILKMRLEDAKKEQNFEDISKKGSKKEDKELKKQMKRLKREF